MTSPAVRRPGRVRPHLPRLSPLGWLGWGVVAALSVSTIYPVAFLAMTSLKGSIDYSADPLGLPTQPTLDWYQSIYRDGQIIPYVANSIIIVVSSVALILAIAVLAGTALSLMRFPLRRVGLLAVVLIMFLPASVQIVPIFLTVNQLGLLNSYLGMALVFTAVHAPFAVYLMASYLQGVPHEIMEAAECDGASAARVVWRIVLPLALPMVVTLGVLEALWIWNDLLFPLLILQSDDMRPLTVGMAMLKGQYPSAPQLAAIAFVSMLPPLAMFAVFHRQVVSGLSAGAVK